MKSKNILCLSWCDADEVVNYGQILQAIAMMRLLRKMTDGGIKYISYRNRSIRERFDYYIYHINCFNGHLQSYIKSLSLLHNIILSNDIDYYQVMNKKSINDISKNSDVLVCGSDQLWHPQNFDDIYFLNFGDPKQKRIAFAPSLPKTYCEMKYADKYRTIGSLLKNFDAIAVRECSSVEFIKEISDRDDVVDVLDPTLLVGATFWETLIETKTIEEPYIFVYIPNGMNEKMKEKVNSIKKAMGIKYVYALVTRGRNLFDAVASIKFVSVGQFLYLIKNATCVITSSFHAVVFSSIFHTAFYAYDVPIESRGEDCRLSDVLSLMGLESRNIGQDDNIILGDINFESVEERLSIKRKESIEFLNAQLNGYDI